MADSRREINRRYREANREKLRLLDRERKRRLREGDRERSREMQRIWRAANPGKVRQYNDAADAKRNSRDWFLRRRYGITVEFVESLLIQQGNVCALCRSAHWGGMYNKPHVDHCHHTGRIRGMLCNRCNTGLGKFHDRPDELQSAIYYLRADDLAGISAGFLL